MKTKIWHVEVRYNLTRIKSVFKISANTREEALKKAFRKLSAAQCRNAVSATAVEEKTWLYQRQPVLCMNGRVVQ